jgi:hypothetical protein
MAFRSRARRAQPGIGVLTQREPGGSLQVVFAGLWKVVQLQVRLG